MYYCYTMKTHSFVTGYEVAWKNVAGTNSIDASFSDFLSIKAKYMTVNELEREVDDIEHIALKCVDDVPDGLSENLSKSVKWLAVQGSIMFEEDL